MVLPMRVVHVLLQEPGVPPEEHLRAPHWVEEAALLAIVEFLISVAVSERVGFGREVRDECGNAEFRTGPSTA